jgi:hypothetical protein
MAGTSAAVVGYFRTRPRQATLWQRLVAPAAATVILLAMFVLVLVNFDSLLGTDPTSPLRWILPGLVLLFALAGAAWGKYLKARKPEVYDGIGRTAMAPEHEEPIALPTLPQHRH